MEAAQTRRHPLSGSERLEQLAIAADYIAEGVREGRVRASEHRIGAQQLASMVFPRTAEGIKRSETIRPWVMRACAAAGLPVNNSRILCREVVEGVGQLKEYAGIGYTVMAENLDAG